MIDRIKNLKKSSNFKSNIKVYCLTIKDGRRYEIAKKRLDIYFPNNYEFIFANAFERDFVHKVLNANDKAWKLSMFSNNYNYLQKAYSCADGHRNIMRTFLNQTDADWALVLEDDYYVNSEVIKQLEPILKSAEFDVYHLGHFAWLRHSSKVTDFIPKEPAIVKFNKWAAQSGAYIVNKDFAVKFYKSFLPIKNPTDVQLNQLILDIYKKVPCIDNISCYADSNLVIHSEIGQT